MSYNNKRKKKTNPYNIYLLYFSKDIDKKVYFSLTSETLHYPEKAQKP